MKSGACVVLVNQVEGTKCLHKDSNTRFLILWGIFLVPMWKTAYISITISVVSDSTPDSVAIHERLSMNFLTMIFLGCQVFLQTYPLCGLGIKHTHARARVFTPRENLSSPIHLYCIFGLWGKPENLEKTHFPPGFLAVIAPPIARSPPLFLGVLRVCPYTCVSNLVKISYFVLNL